MSFRLYFKNGNKWKKYTLESERPGRLSNLPAGVGVGMAVQTPSSSVMHIPQISPLRCCPERGGCLYRTHSGERALQSQPSTFCLASLGDCWGSSLFTGWVRDDLGCQLTGVGREDRRGCQRDFTSTLEKELFSFKSNSWHTVGAQ